MEYVMKLAAEHTARLTNSRENVATTKDIKQIIVKWIHMQGLRWTDDDKESEGERTDAKLNFSALNARMVSKEGETSRELEESRKWAKRVELTVFERADPIGWVTHAEKL